MRHNLDIIVKWDVLMIVGKNYHICMGMFWWIGAYGWVADENFQMGKLENV